MGKRKRQRLVMIQIVLQTGNVWDNAVFSELLLRDCLWFQMSVG